LSKSAYKCISPGCDNADSGGGYCPECEDRVERIYLANTCQVHVDNRGRQYVYDSGKRRYL